MSALVRRLLSSAGASRSCAPYIPLRRPSFSLTESSLKAFAVGVMPELNAVLKELASPRRSAEGLERVDELEPACDESCVAEGKASPVILVDWRCKKECSTPLPFAKKRDFFLGRWSLMTAAGRVWFDSSS